MMLMYFAIWLITLLQVAFSSIDADSPAHLQPLLIVSIPGVTIGCWSLWKGYVSRHERREERRIERKLKEARRAIALRGGYTDQMFVASKSGDISVANLISETDEAWTLKLVVEKREIVVSKKGSQQRAFSVRSDALKWAGVGQEVIEHFVTLDSGKAASINQMQS